MAEERTRQLAEFVVGTSLSDMDPAACDLVAPAVADSVAVMLAGRQAEAGKVILQYAQETMPGGSSRGCWVAGLPSGATPETAALVNSTLAHALDYDDALPGAGHPSALVLAAILAAAEATGTKLDGDRVTEAFVMGFEVVAKIAKVIGVKHYYLGWHTTSTGGTFGTTAAAAKVLGLDVTQTRVALGIAASLSSGIQRNFGTATKPLHSGLAARNGVLAAMLARSGFTAALDVLDGEQSYLDLYSAGASYPENLDRLGDPWSLVEPGTALKKFPCCYATARSVDAMLQLRAAHGLTPDSVKRIQVALPKGGTQALLYSRPTTGLAGKFSMEYVIAAALLDGHVKLASFTDDQVMRPQIRELLEIVDVVEERELRPEDPDGITSSPATGGRTEVRVDLADGQRVEMALAEPHGGPKNPLGWEDIEAKFLDCATYGGYDPAQAKVGFERLKNLRDQKDVLTTLRELTGS